MNVARDIAVQMCDVFDAKDYVGIVNVSYIAAVSTFPTTYYSIVCACVWCCVCRSICLSADLGERVFSNLCHD